MHGHEHDRSDDEYDRAGHHEQRQSNLTGHGRIGVKTVIAIA